MLDMGIYAPWRLVACHTWHLVTVGDTVSEEYGIVASKLVPVWWMLGCEKVYGLHMFAFCTLWLSTCVAHDIWDLCFSF